MNVPTTKTPTWIDNKVCLWSTVAGEDNYPMGGVRPRPSSNTLLLSTADAPPFVILPSVTIIGSKTKSRRVVIVASPPARGILISNPKSPYTDIYTASTYGERSGGRGKGAVPRWPVPPMKCDGWRGTRHGGIDRSQGGWRSRRRVKGYT